jgi:hypothetical protein
VITQEDGTKDALPFTYLNGCMTFDTEISSAESGSAAFTCTGEIFATYGTNKDVKLQGTLRMALSTRPNDFYIDEYFTGSKPLPAKS